MVTFAEACKSLVDCISSLNPDWEGRHQFNGTPERLTRLYQDFCWSQDRIDSELERHFRTFQNGYDEMLTSGPFTVWTLCPHHLLPVRMDCWVGYIPEGKVLGLSKIVRISETLARRPTMQEQFTPELANLFMEKLAPKGVGVKVVGIHGCMASRGVKQGSPVTTTSLKGCFKKEPSVKSEFLQSTNQ